MNKTFQKGSGTNEVTYPVYQDDIDNMNDCRLVNPKVGDDHEYKIPEDFDIEKSTNEIVQVRLGVQKGIFPYWFMQKYYPFKKEFGEYRFPIQIFMIEGLGASHSQDLADVVHMDSPSDMPRMVLKWLTNPMYQQEQNVKAWTPKFINFLETIPDVEEQISDGCKRSLIKAFEMKYFFGLARPEEIFSEKTGLDGKLLTAYPEGCPNHPSFPAGHASAAAGGLVSVIKEFPDLTDIQLKAILDTGYSWAMFRSFAGVHHAVDNIAGLMANGFEKYMRKEVVEMYKA